MCGKNPGRCDFETKLCDDWHQERDDVFDWIIGSRSSPTSGTGPSADHTLLSALGHYLYVETSYPRKPNDTARLASFPVSGASNGCTISFYTHMKGNHIGRLNVLLRHSYGNGPSDFIMVDSIVGKFTKT